MVGPAMLMMKRSLIKTKRTTKMRNSYKAMTMAMKTMKRRKTLQRRKTLKAVKMGMMMEMKMR